MLNEKNFEWEVEWEVQFKNMVWRGGIQENVCWKGVGNISKKEGVGKKGVKKNREGLWIYVLLTLFRMSIFGAAHRWGGGKKTPLPKICHRYPTMMKLDAVKPYLKQIQKIYLSWHTPCVLLTSAFFPRNRQILLYQEIQIQILFWCIISNSFNFSWVFKYFFNKPGYNFDDVSKDGYLRPS